MSKPLITRQQAIDSGLKRYYTGEPCKKGHVAERFTSSSGCVECVHPKVHAIRATGVTHKKLAHNATLLLDRHYNADQIAACKAYLQQCADYHASQLREIGQLPGWCGVCDGSGKDIDPNRNPVVKPCPACGGSGTDEALRALVNSVTPVTDASGSQG